MLTFGVRAHDMDEAPFEELIRSISEKGLGCMQFALKKSIYEFSVENEALTPGLAMMMKKILHKYNVDIAVLGCYLNLATPDEEELKKTMDTYKAQIRFAKYLGCGVVGTETGAVNKEYRPDPLNQTEEALEILIKNLGEIVAYAEKVGVTVAIEPVYCHIVHTVEKARKVLDRIDSPNLQIILDPVNLLSTENYEKQDEIMKEAFEKLGENIIAVHAKDFRIEDNSKLEVSAGEGDLNYPLLLSWLKEHKPYIHILLEDVRPEKLDVVRGYIEKNYDSI